MAERTTAIRGEQLRADVAANGLAKDGEFNLSVLAGIGSGVSDTVDAIDVTAEGVAIRVDGSTIDANGSDQIYIPASGVTSNELDITDTYDFTVSGAGTILVNDPTTDNQVANKAYVDAVAQGLDVKGAVVAMADSNVTLANEQTIDGIPLVAGDRVLCTGQTNAVENCIWVVVDGGAWTRPTDFEAGIHASGAFCFIQQGTTYEDQGWVQTQDDISGEGDVVGTDELQWTQFSSAGTITSGAGVDISAGVASLDLSTVTVGTINVAADSLTFLDADGNVTRLDSIADLVTGMKGDGLTATSGVLAVGDGDGIVVNANDVAVGAGDGIVVNADDVAVQAGVTSGAANVADVIVVSADGVGVSVDEVTIDENGSGQLEVIDEGITEPKLAVSNAPADGQVLGWTASGSTMTWIDNDAADAVTEGDFIKDDQSALCDKVTVAFTLSTTPVVASLGVYLNGLLQQEGAGKDYTLTGTTVTFADAPHNNDTLIFMYVEKDT